MLKSRKKTSKGGRNDHSLFTLNPESQEASISVDIVFLLKSVVTNFIACQARALNVKGKHETRPDQNLNSYIKGRFDGEHSIIAPPDRFSTIY